MPLGIPNLDFELTFLLGLFRDRNPAPPRQDQDIQKFPDTALGSLPFPSVPIPGPTSLPGSRPPFGDFPQLPGANDPIFRRTIGKRLLGLGGVLIDLEILIIRELNKRQDKRADDIIREQDRKVAEAVLRGSASRAQRERDLRVTKQIEALINAPETFEIEPEIPEPRPGSIVFESTFPDQFPIEIQFPSQVPDRSAAPEPVDRDALEFPDVPRPTVGFPQPLPTSIPLPSPIGFPVSIPAPVEIPFQDPLTLFDPPSVPSGGVPDSLTFSDPNASFQPNPFANPQLNPRSCPKRKCDDDLDDPRLKCFKGLYKEGRLDTDFTSWVPIDCDTGRELGNNVVPFGR